MFVKFCLSTPRILLFHGAAMDADQRLYDKHYHTDTMHFRAPWDENDLNTSTLTSGQAWSDLWNDLNSAGVFANMTDSAEIHCEYSGACGNG